jgi:hypothetical protein
MMFAAVVHDKVSGTIRDHGFIADVSRYEQVTFRHQSTLYLYRYPGWYKLETMPEM